VLFHVDDMWTSTKGEGGSVSGGLGEGASKTGFSCIRHWMTLYLYVRMVGGTIICTRFQRGVKYFYVSNTVCIWTGRSLNDLAEVGHRSTSQTSDSTLEPMTNHY